MSLQTITLWILQVNGRAETGMRGAIALIVTMNIMTDFHKEVPMIATVTVKREGAFAVKIGVALAEVPVKTSKQ